MPPKFLFGIRKIRADFQELLDDYGSKRFRCTIPDPDRSGEFMWWVTLKAPEGSVYEGAEFDMQLWFGNDYPFQPPMGQFVSLIYHPNIDARIPYGMWLNCMRSQWSCESSVKKMLEGILKALSDPNPDRQFGNKNGPLRPDIAYEYKYCREEFEKNARALAAKYIRKPGQSAWDQ